MTHPTILTAHQREVLRLFASEVDLCDAFVLSGGTALAAFHLHHRLSDDLDFFSLERVDDLRVRRFVDRVVHALSAKDQEMRRIFDRHLFFLTLQDDALLKIEFTHYPYPSLEKPRIIDGLRIDGLRDIAANKLAAMLDRFEPKDYYDLFLLIQGSPGLARLRADTEKKFGMRIDAVTLGAALVRGDSLPILPHLLTPIDPNVVSAFFLSLARSLKKETIG